MTTEHAHTTAGDENVHHVHPGASGSKVILGFLLVFAAILILIAIVVRVNTSHKEAEVDKAIVQAAPAQQVIVDHTPHPTTAFPRSGEGHATKEVGIKAFLDPMKTHTRPSSKARYVFAEDHSLSFVDNAGGVIDHTESRKVWWDFPAGNYIVYPLDADDIFFRWY